MRWGALALVLLCALPCAAQDPDELLLRSKGILPTQDSLRAYLRTLYPQPGAVERMERLIRDLESPDAAVRDYAARMIHREGGAAAAVLRRAVDHEEPEVRRLVRRLLARAQKQLDPGPLYSAYVTIARNRVPGLVPEILETLALTTEGHIRVAGQRALEASATDGDADRLRAAIAGDDTELRAAATRALGRLLRDDARPELVALLGDDKSLVRLAAAVSLARLRDARSLPALVELLGCADAKVRFETISLLRELSGARYGYSAYADEASRAAAIRAWREWARLENPKVNWEAAREDFGGVKQRIVIAVGKRPSSEIIEIDLDGKVYRRHDVQGYTYGVYAHRNGNVLVSLYNEKVVAEYDPGGKEVWRSKILKSNVAAPQRLSDGNTLIAFPQLGEVVELSRRSETVWSASTGVGCYYAQRLSNGITRVSIYNTNQILELDRAGQVRHRIPAGAQPFMTQSLPSGRLVVCFPGRAYVAELDREGKEIRKWVGFNWPTSAFLLPSGELIVGDRTGVHRIGTGGKRRVLLSANGLNWIAYY